MNTSHVANYQDGYYGMYDVPLQYSSYSTAQHQIQPESEYCNYQNEANLDQQLYSEVGVQNAAIIVLDSDQSYGSYQPYSSDAAFDSEDSNDVMTFANKADLLSYLSTFDELKNIQILPIVSEMENTEKFTNETIEYCAPLETTIVNEELIPVLPEQPIQQKPSTKKTTTKGIKRNRTQLVYENSSFVCEPCDRSFGRRSSLVQHNNVHHSGPREHRCEECGKRYHKLEELHHHVQRHVAHEKPYKCTECPRQFNYLQDLARHGAVRHGVAKHACQYCGKRMARRDHLMTHEASHARRNRLVKLAK